ncbi:MAG TPA: tetratricopeptide repeat protein [Steroidobacteraceae bacterium]|nr:tetratricopeptide repeat protein [Steroidobacteraceae bacterium]
MRHVESWRATFTAAFAAAGCLVLAGAAGAQQIDYDPARPAALRKCDDPLHRGRVEEARACLRPLLRADEPVVRAEAAWALGDLRNANEFFRAAVDAEPRATRPRVRWGRMYLDASQYADAGKLFQEALQIDKGDRGARIAMARLMAEQFDGDVTEQIALLQAEDPDQAETHLVAARIAIERGELDAAVRSAQRAQTLAEQQKLPPVEAQTLLAAVEVVRNRDPGQWTKAALAYNPRYGTLFETLAHFEVIRRRYKEADAWLKRAVAVQPDLWSAQRELGLNLMRLGQMTEARTPLVAAYEGDPFNITTVNTLRLLDSLAQFEVIDTPPPALKLMLNKGESAPLRPYVQQLAHEAMATFSRRYGYTPAGPVGVEIYPNHDDFAVRIAGLPGIGLLGVTFGDLVAMDSPSGRKSGDFHWGSTLWHEMAHVYTLGATRHRVPRWLSEGLSMYEEWTTGPTPGVSVSPKLLDVFAADRFLPIARLDDGFMRPTYEGQVQMAYMQAGLMCLFADQRWGFAKLAQFLKAFNDDSMTTANAVRTAFGVTEEQFDREFRDFMKQRFQAYLADPKRWASQMQRAHTMLEARNFAAARDAAQAAILMLPEFTSEGSAYEVLAEAEEGLDNPAAAIAALIAWRKAGGWNPSGLRKLGALLLAANREADAAEVLAAVNYADPLTVDGHDQLGALLINQRKGAEALREYQVLLALQPLDTAAANLGLARAYRLTGDAAEARRRLLEALDTAPNYRPAQKLLLEMTGDRKP